MMRKIELNPDEVSRRYLAGESELAISLALGVSRAVVKRTLDSAGVTRRSQSDAMRTRLAKMTPAERSELAKNAHDAVRGSKRTQEQLEKRARGVERNKGNVSEAESLVASAFEARGYGVVQQKAFGVYNVDIYVPSLNLVVEVLGGAWHSNKPHRRRLTYLTGLGLNLVAVWVDGRNSPLDKESLVESLVSAKPYSGFRVFTGNGKKLIASFQDEMPDRIPTP
jgi:very-short-patch-repair endonuclease